MAIFKGVNDPVTIKFTASSSQTGAATLRIGTTLSFAGGRPQVKVGGPPEPQLAFSSQANETGQLVYRSGSVCADEPQLARCHPRRVQGVG
jgi:hypothetical protein